MEKHKLIDNKEESRYEYHIDSYRPHIEYKINNDGVIFLTHTVIPDELQDRGIGTELVKDSLEDIKKRGLRLVPLCGFVASYISKNPEWEDILREDITIG